jgi:hypothetical protein
MSGQKTLAEQQQDLADLLLRNKYLIQAAIKEVERHRRDVFADDPEMLTLLAGTLETYQEIQAAIEDYHKACQPALIPAEGS